MADLNVCFKTNQHTLPVRYCYTLSINYTKQFFTLITKMICIVYSIIKHVHNAIKT